MLKTLQSSKSGGFCSFILKGLKIESGAYKSEALRIACVYGRFNVVFAFRG